jgi:BON domain
MVGVIHLKGVSMNKQDLTGNPNESKEYAQDRDLNLRGDVKRPGMHAQDYGASRSNDSIRKEIYKRLGEESGIDIKVEAGTVRICGMVDNEDIKASLTDTIQGISGVTDVIDETKVKPFNH